MPSKLMTISVRLDDDEYEWLTKQAMALGVSRGEFLRETVRSRSIEKQKKGRAIRRKALSKGKK